MKVINACGGKFPRVISSYKYNDYIKKVCQLEWIIERVQGTKAEVIKTMCGSRIEKMTRNKLGEYAKW